MHMAFTAQLPKEVEMADIAQHQHCTRPWYMRPPVWLLGLVVVVGLIVFAVARSSGGPTVIPYSSFLDQLDAGNVASVIFQGTQIDGRFKKAPANVASNGSAQQDVFRSRVPEFGDPSLLPALRNGHVAIAVASSQWVGTGVAAIFGVIGAFILAKPMLLVIAAAFIAGLVRVARGGKMDVRSILSMVPMFRSVSGHNGKQEQSGGDTPRVGN
jgi:FtsH Extracellular